MRTMISNSEEALRALPPPKKRSPLGGGGFSTLKAPVREQMGGWVECLRRWSAETARQPQGDSPCVGFAPWPRRSSPESSIPKMAG